MVILGLILDTPLEGVSTQLGENFTRLENVFSGMLDVAVGSVAVTGTLNVKTGLSTVNGALCQIGVTPAYSRQFCKIVPGAAAGTVDITVYDGGFALSTVATQITWAAFGQLVLS